MLKEYNPDASTVCWEIVNGWRIDRIHIVDTASPIARHRMDLIGDDQSVEMLEALSPHSFWKAINPWHVREFEEGNRFLIVGHTYWMQTDEHIIWYPAYYLSQQGATHHHFRSAKSRSLAEKIVQEEDLGSRTVDKAWADSLEPRYRWNEWIKVLEGIPA